MGQAIATWASDRFSVGREDQGNDETLVEQWQTKLRDVFADELIDHAYSHPWTTDEIPSLFQWVQQNRKPLDLLVEASARPRYYSPSPSFVDGSDNGLIAMWLPDIQGLRNAVRALQVRAMWSLGEGHPLDAWSDIHACHRLARHAARNNTLIGQLMAIALDGIANRKTVVILYHGELNREQARQILTDLQSLPRLPAMARSLDEGERLWFLDTVLRMATGKFTDQEPQGLLGAGEPLQALMLGQIDWNFVLREGNRWYDRMVAAASLPTRAERHAEFEKIAFDLDKRSSMVNRPEAWAGSVLSRRNRSEMLASILLSLFLPALDAAISAEDRAKTSMDITQITAALAVYRAEHGEYPARLADLAPEIFSQLSIDLYSEQPFLYQRKNDGGYLLYSVFETEIDDQGTDFSGEIIQGEWVDEKPEDFDFETSDAVIRLPLPVLKLPAVKAMEKFPYRFGRLAFGRLCLRFAR